MNPRIVKEVRVQLLPLGLMLVAAILPLFWMKYTEELMFPLFGLACSVMAAMAFGHEYQHRTLATLLALPVSRLVVWKEKMLVLAGLLAAGTICVGPSLARVNENRFGQASDVVGWSLVLIPLCAWCGTPLWTLLMGGSLMGVIFGILVPGCLLVLNSIVFEKFLRSSDGEVSSGITLLLGYCAVAFVLCLLRFRKLEALDGALAGPELGLPSWAESLLAKPLGAKVGRSHGSLAPLFKKELRLQQVTFMAAGLFCLLALLAAMSHQAPLNFHQEPGVFGVVWILDFVVFMAFVPLVTGAFALTEEKSWGVADWHFTLPPSSLQQWLAKMATVYSISTGLGLLLPLLVAWAASAQAFLPASETLPFFLCFQLLVVSVVIYAASLTSNTVRAVLLGLGLVIGVVAGFQVGVLAVFKYQQIHGRVFQALAEDPAVQVKIIIAVAISAQVLLIGVLQLFSFKIFLRRTIRPTQVAGQGLFLALFVVSMGVLLGLLGIQ